MRRRPALSLSNLAAGCGRSEAQRGARRDVFGIFPRGVGAASVMRGERPSSPNSSCKGTRSPCAGVPIGRWSHVSVQPFWPDLPAGVQRSRGVERTKFCLRGFGRHTGNGRDGACCL